MLTQIWPASTKSARNGRDKENGARGTTSFHTPGGAALCWPPPNKAVEERGPKSGRTELGVGRAPVQPALCFDAVEPSLGPKRGAGGAHLFVHVYNSEPPMRGQFRPMFWATPQTSGPLLRPHPVDAQNFPRAGPKDAHTQQNIRE